VLITGVVNGEPVPSWVPPTARSYQLIVPPVPVASRFTVPIPQRVPGVVPVICGLFTVAVATFDSVQIVVPNLTSSLKYLVTVKGPPGV